MQSLEAIDIQAGDSAVRGFVHVPEDASGDVTVLTHGAGANCNARLLVEFATALCEAGWTVLRCDLPFRQTRPHGPPPRGSAERDQQGLRAAVEVLRQRVDGRVVMAGHSYGGRMASMLAADEPGLVDGLLLLSYPLHPPNKPEQMRTAHFPALRTPAIFVHGTRDPFASPEELADAVAAIPARTELFPIEGAGHDLAVKKKFKWMEDVMPRLRAMLG